MLKASEVQAGIVVRFIGRGGYEMELEKAHKSLETNRTYMVSQVFRDRWGTYIYLEGVPNKSFIMDMFEDAGNEAAAVLLPPSAPKVRKVRPPAPKQPTT